jgi:antitoxin CptB
MQPRSQTTDDLDTRRRRASFRAHHRGTKEMDLIVGRYADAKLAAYSADELTRFERLLTIPDPTLQEWILAGRGVDVAEFKNLVADIRVFHGLSDKAD